VDYEGKTALICACQEGNVAIARALIAAGAKLDTKSKSSAKKKDKMFGRTALLEACYQGHAGIVQALLEAGADLETQDVLGRTPLIAACVGGHHEVSQLVMAAGGDINTQDLDGMSPLIATTSKGHGHAAEAMIAIGLIGVGSNLNLKNKHRKTALMCAIDSGHSEIVLALRKAGAQ
jgi:ankyrin repeat protein